MVVSILPTGPEIEEQAQALGVRHESLLVEADHAGMEAIRDLVAHGKLRPVIAGTFPLEDVAQAHAAGETRHVAGKLVLVMD